MPGLSEWLAVAGGGAIGATARYGTFLWAERALPRGLPWGTLLVNIIGSLLIGIAFVLLVERGFLSPAWRQFFTVGLLGAFTTFSAFSLDAVMLFNAGEAVRAFAYVLTSVMVCILAAMLAIFLTRSLLAL